MPLAPQRSVRLFEADPDLIASLDRATAARARRHTYAEVTDLPAARPVESLRIGRWTLSETRIDAIPFGFLVLDGVLLRREALGCHRSVELLGSGALLSPLQDELDGPGLGCTTSWEVLERATVAILEHDFHAFALRFPGVLAELMRRATQRARWQTVHLLIVQFPQLERRLMLLLWHLADRWGRVEPNGVLLPLRLAQATLGELVGARRSSVNAALRNLIQRGAIAKAPAGGWLLFGPPEEGGHAIAASPIGAMANR
jgi:CRP/FNR family cyclic AMP-dependent transcriptional regulator